MYSLFAPGRRVENFRHMDRIFPYRSIAASRRPFAFPRDTRPLHVEYRFDGERRSLDGFLERVAATGLLVIARTSVDPGFNAHIPETMTVFRATRDALRRRDQAAVSVPSR